MQSCAVGSGMLGEILGKMGVWTLLPEVEGLFSDEGNLFLRETGKSIMPRTRPS